MIRIVLVLLLLVASRVEAATYWVSKSGSNGNPCTNSASPLGASAKLTILGGFVCLTQPGDVLYIMSGTYQEHLTEGALPASGNAGNYILIAEYPGEAVTVTNNGASEIIRFQDGSKQYIEFRDLTLDGSTWASDGTMGIFLSNEGNGGGGCCGAGTVAANLRFLRVEVKFAYANGIIGGGNNMELLDMHVHDNGLFPIASYPPGAMGVYFQSDDSVIRGGRFHNNKCAGIRMGNSATLVDAENNIIEGVQVYNNGNGWPVNGTPSDCDNFNVGILLGGKNNTVRNSIIRHNTGHGIGTYGLSGKTVQGEKAYHNTIVGNSSCGIDIGAGAGSLNFAATNNILYQNGTAICDAGSGTTQTTNLTSNPAFTDPGNNDYTLQAGSVAINAGTLIPSITTDFAGNPRQSGSAVDIGAYEFDEGGEEPPPPGPEVNRLRFTQP